MKSSSELADMIVDAFVETYDEDNFILSIKNNEKFTYKLIDEFTLAIIYKALIRVTIS